MSVELDSHAEGAAAREAFLRAFAVSQETAAKFDRYAALLAEWQTRMNLVAPSTLPHIWRRHFHDSAQLFPLLPQQAKTLVDLGSGAGFPGMVLALLGAKNGHLSVHLIEATQKKAGFLRHVAAELGLDVSVHDRRAEDIKDLRADVITARALAALPELLKLAQHFKRADSVLLFLKGAKAAEEVAAARQRWCFDVEMSKSSSDDSGNVLILRHLRHKQEVSHARSRARRAKS